MVCGVWCVEGRARGSFSQYLNHFWAKSTFSDICNTITKMGGSNFSSDLDVGRRPELKSDEKLDPPILVHEIISFVCEIAGR